MLTVGIDEPGQIAAWHRRGALRFSIALVIMVTASAVTGAMSYAVVGVMVGAAVVATAAFTLLTRSGISARRWTLLLWPVATCSTMGVLHSVSDFSAALLVGLIVLAFQFVGITQPSGRGLWLMLPAALLFLHITELSGRDAAVRLPIAMLVWLVVSEVPARLLGELRDKQRALEQLAATDALTGLLNRSRLEAHLEIADDSSAVAVIDIDHFKAFNDAHGHIAGDLALMEFADALRAGTRGIDLVFRYGGEEFLVIFARTTTAEAADILDRFAESWAARGSGITFSAGVAAGGEDAVSAADQLLYKAKSQGRARVLTAERALVP
ncbi:GGDEF domain-containing protein [Aeromicrobium sp.]|uniref:GGDEF domain-containing protein n=1 Tax=Aeromicrobium sp. TaxID=1871063 RepID=UPI002FC7F887